MFRRIVVTVLVVLQTHLSASAFDGQTRPAANQASLRAWLENMVWHHGYSSEEVQQVTGLSAEDVQARLKQFSISARTRPQRPEDRLFVLPYPGGRHPRIGFLDGAIEPQRETKLSVFCPWDENSYAVMDIPEAIWSNLGLTYLAHTHIDTVWTKQGITLSQQEWDARPDGSYNMRRRLPNGIEFGTHVMPLTDHIRMTMWLKNGTNKPLRDLRVQNCVMLKAAEGFAQQTTDNKKFTADGYAAVRSKNGSRWIITAWDPLHRAWGNKECPCLHADPKFPDCQPGETKYLRGWFSFYEGTDIAAELRRIEATGWKRRPVDVVAGNVVGSVVDAETGKRIPCRLYVQNVTTGQWHFARSVSVAGSAVVYDRRTGNTSSIERHTTLSADGFQLQLDPGRYRIRAERGKEYVPAEKVIEVTASDKPVRADLSLRRFINMAERGWFSGDTHVHRKMDELPNVVAAEDLNVALPLNYWVRDSTQVPSASGPPLPSQPDYIDGTHVIYPVNTEYEIFSVNRKRHTQGAVFVLNHRTPLNLPAPPALPIAEEARRQGAILDLDKHSWNWSMMIVPVMGVDLFELSNNHHWRTQFGFPSWTIENAPSDWKEIETTNAGFTERGWTEFGLQTYYCLLNCGYRMRVTGGTASGVHPVPLGHGRVYVHCGSKPFNYERWISQLNKGHSFVTQGPLPDVTFNGQLPGTTWRKTSPQNSVRVVGAIESLNPLKSIEVIVNGRVAAATSAPPEKTDRGSYLTNIESEVSFEGSAWIALRCFEDLPAEKISFAHTNPVFVDVPGKPVRPRRNRVQFLVQRMDEEIARNSGVLSDEAVAEFRQAKSIYEALLQHAE